MMVSAEIGSQLLANSGSPRLSELVTSREWVPANARVGDVAERFRREPQLEALAVLDQDGRAVGLLDRTKLLLKMSHQFGHALYARASVTRVLEPGTLVAEGDESLEAILGRVIERTQSDVYDAILVIDETGRFLGTVSVKQILMHQSFALTNSLVERQLVTRRAEELEKVNELKSSFIAHVTHELRAPVNAIIGMVELLTRSSHEGNVAKMGELLGFLGASAASLRALVNNVLDLSKLEAGRMDVFVEEFDIVETVREVGQVSRVLVGQKAVSVEVVAHDGALLLRSDPVKVKQVLMNLASNAAKFTERGQVRLTVTPCRGGVVVEVRDSGVGIPASKRDAIFQPFVQIEDVHTRRHDGTGLGLSICAKLLELLGGSLELESEPGQGSSFVVFFPNLKGPMSA